MNATGYENPDSRRAPFINASTTKDSATYRIDPELVSVDLWEYEDALELARSDPESLAAVAALYTGELARGGWCTEHYPESALEALDRARALDPDTEELCPHRRGSAAPGPPGRRAQDR
ncbi:hypothetical protein ACIBH1_37755 [Nonomuraea sp. NPDC050663]|uniref:hypothetical protein n=1 Tax=Nonomuraea sp. NPDC050663 TaxID=3364370 RepID=UPI0037B8890F